MNDSIFKNYAPQYWSQGLPVIPLRERDKRPAINGWTEFGGRMPTTEEQASWMSAFPNGNIGLPLGSASNVCVIDVDTNDEKLIAAILDVCGPSPWVRVGKKGMVLAYRFAGMRNFSFEIQGKELKGEVSETKFG